MDGSQSTTMDEKKKIKTLVFYTGIFFNLFGTGLILGGVFSDNWVTLSEAHGSVPTSVRLLLTSHFGPWKACRYDRFCGDPWEIVPGIQKNKLQLIQLLIGLAAAIHLVGMTILCFKCWHLFFYRAHWLIAKFNNSFVAEITVGSAAMLTTIAVFVMGQVKRKVILRHHQREHTGYSFLITLIGILMIVLGITLVSLNASPPSHLWLTDPSYRILRWLHSLGTATNNIHLRHKPVTIPNYGTGGADSQVAITCISSTDTFSTQRSSNRSEKLNQKNVEIVENSSDSQRPEDDFLLQNTRGSLGPQDTSSSGASQHQKYQKPDMGKVANREYYGAQLTQSTGSARLSFEGVEAVEFNARPKSPQRSSDKRDLVNCKSKSPGRRPHQRTRTSNETSRSSILQAAKRCAAVTFARPFQMSDRKDDDDESNSSYPGNSGIAVLKFVDV